MNAESAAAPAKEVTATVQEQPTPEQVYQAFAANVAQNWDRIADGERIRIAKKQDYLDKDGKLTQAGFDELKRLKFNGEVKVNEPLKLDALRVLVTLEGDTMRYVKFPKGHARAGELRLAVDKYGFPSAPRPRGRRRAHRSKTDLAVKSLTMSIFRKLFAAKAERLQAVCKEEKIEYQGVPESALPQLGAQAMKAAVAIVDRENTRHRKVRRRMKDLSRRINYGLKPGNTNARKYAHKGSH